MYRHRHRGRGLAGLALGLVILGLGHMRLVRVAHTHEAPPARRQASATAEMASDRVAARAEANRLAAEEAAAAAAKEAEANRLAAETVEARRIAAEIERLTALRPGAKKRSRVRGGLRLLQTSHQGRRSGANAARSVAGATARSRRAHSSFAHRGTAPFVRNSLIHVSNPSRIEEDGGRLGPRAAARSSPRLPRASTTMALAPEDPRGDTRSPASAWRGLSGRLA